MVRLKTLVVISLLALFLSPLVRPSYAHVLESDGTVGAVVHISPDDDPVAGEQSGFFFEFKDKENKFKPELCNCTFTVIQAGEELYSQPLFQTSAEPSLTDVSIFYTFPEKNIYTIKVTGEPTTPNAFKPFTLTYDIRVDRETDTTDKTSDQQSLTAWIERHTFHIIGTIIMAGVVGYSFYTNQLKGKKTKQGGKTRDKK